MKGPTVAVVAGGVGAARFLRALAEVWPVGQTTAVVNTADDTVLHGLHVSPDIDTVVYTLAGAIDPDRGWGLADESWTAMASLSRYAAVRPPTSRAATTWFGLGDRDLATHLFRTARLAEGATLTEVTSEISAAWQVGQTILPMTDDPVSTMLTLAADGREISFQEYFVEQRHAVEIAAVRVAGADRARPSVAAVEALRCASAVIIAPSNPIVSIGPVRSLSGVDEVLADRREAVVAISPLVGGAALKGPADRMLGELGHEVSVVGVARLYAPIAGTLVIDPADADLADRVVAEGMRVVITPSVMSRPGVGASLARQVLSAAGVTP